MISFRNIGYFKRVLIIVLIALFGILLLLNIDLLMPKAQHQVSSQETIMDANVNSILIGMQNGPFFITGSGLQTVVPLDTTLMEGVRNSFLKATSTDVPNQIYLHIENVKGTLDATILNVSVQHQHAGHLSLYGLRKASKNNGLRDANGLTFILDITPVIKQLYQESNTPIDTLNLHILPKYAIGDAHELTIARISIHQVQH